MNLKTLKNRIHKYLLNRIKFYFLSKKKRIFLYAGDKPRGRYEHLYSHYIGLSMHWSIDGHLWKNVLDPLPLPNDVVDVYQSEDVFEHLPYAEVTKVLNEVYRVLKKGGYLRLSLPNYQCEFLQNRCLKDEQGNLLFDPGGGGQYINNQVTDGGHLWFPTYGLVKAILEQSNFVNYEFYHYNDDNGSPIMKQIDYSKGFVMRTPDHDDRVQSPPQPMSIVVDCFK